MKAYEFEIPGKPGTKQRPRFNRQTGRTYTPKETASYEAQVVDFFLGKYPEHVPVIAPVRMTIMAFYPIPASWSKKKKQAAMSGEIFPGKPDWDNVGKIISDALNEVAFKDDSQIYQCTVAKMYSDRPRVFVQITTFEGG